MRQHLSSQAQQDLADVLPYLACGEESAVYAFTGRIQTSLTAQMSAVLDQIAADESHHADFIRAIQDQLPSARQALSPSRVAFFFKRLETPQAEQHLARIAALDWAVCKLLQPILSINRPISQVPALHQAFHRLRQDEARHVRLACAMARQLGVSAAQQTALNHQVQEQLNRLMLPVRDALSRLAQA